MTTTGKKVAQRVIAMVVIVAILDVVGISSMVITFFVGVGFLVWLVAQRSNRRETRTVFEFYISANEMLRDDEHRWYGFEITDVIDRGERALASMPDPPPLVYFAVGSLYHRVGDYDNAVENLACVVDEELAEEHHRSSPSPQLRRYVEMLRNLEREPAVAPQALAAVRSLERARRSRAVPLLAESQQRLEQVRAVGGQVATAPVPTKPSPKTAFDVPWSPERTLNSIKPPRPISEVLRDVYEDEKKTA
jgi:hypothetical protein